MDTSNQQGFNGLLHPSNFYPGLLQPTFMAATPTVALGDMYYSQDGVNFVRLPVGANGQILTVSSGIPSWKAPASPVWTSYTPVITPNNSMTFTGISINLAQYITIGKIITCILSFNGTVGGTPSTLLSATLPVSPDNTGSNYQGACAINNGGADTIGNYYLTTKANFRLIPAGNYTAGSVYCFLTFSYGIA